MKYLEPVMEIQYWEEMDVITLSGGESGSGDSLPGGTLLPGGHSF